MVNKVDGKEEQCTSHVFYLGDSLAHKGMSTPKAIIQKLQLWLKYHFGEKFKDLGNHLEHGKQDDWTDCGIISVNTAAYEIFRDEVLWTVRRKQHEYVTWFLKLCRAHIDDVRLWLQYGSVMS
jgi:hypothetical protein